MATTRPERYETLLDVTTASRLAEQVDAAAAASPLKTTIVPSDEAMRLAAKIAAALDKEQNLVLFCGAVERDGSDLVSAQVALALARIEREPVLLVDTNFSSPSLHSLFAVAAEPGISEMRLRKNSDDCLRLLEGGLSLLTCGDAAKACADWPEYAHLLAKMAERFRWVIASGPALPGGEATLQTCNFDGTVLVTRSGRRRRQELADIQRELASLKANLLGVVISQE